MNADAAARAEGIDVERGQRNVKRILGAVEPEITTVAPTKQRAPRKDKGQPRKVTAAPAGVLSAEQAAKLNMLYTLESVAERAVTEASNAYRKAHAARLDYLDELQGKT